jgi:hypothetical protein
VFILELLDRHISQFEVNPAALTWHVVSKIFEIGGQMREETVQRLGRGGPVP